MDVSRIKKKNLIVWLPLIEGVEVQCRFISQSEFDGIDADSTINGKRDDKLFRSKLARAVVTGWRGIVDEGAEFDCTPENIDYLMEESTEFRLLIMDAPLSISKMLTAEREAERKK